MIPVTRMQERIERAREDGDAALFMELLYAGELVTKLTVAGLVAAVADDRDRHRYRQLHRLVRADGLGEWAAVLDEVLTGPSSQHLVADARDLQKQLTQRTIDGAWEFDAVMRVHHCLSLLGVALEPLAVKVDIRRWFSLFSALRNRTRGHGALNATVAGELCRQFEPSLQLMIANLVVMSIPWAYLYRNLSGKYRVTPLTQGGATAFDALKKTNTARLEDGVYLYLGEPLRVDVVYSDAEASDFFLPNGAFNGRRFEVLSYVTDSTRDIDASPYLRPTSALPESETQGQRRLDVTGRCFSNLPPLGDDYVSRQDIEKELLGLISDDRHPIVTLAGRGGIGKTSLALSVLHSVVEGDRFDVILWLSARDIDLLPMGPKPVQPQILSIKDMAEDVVRLLEPEGAGAKGFKPVDYLAQVLGRNMVGSVLLVLDNFETVKVPQEAFAWIDTYVRAPNKILITTRTRDFKGDYPIELTGMSDDEAKILVDTHADRLGISDLLTEQYRRELYRETEGHPYVIKILLGEIANARGLVKIERIVATKEDILTALFERTYAGLSPSAKRVFLTLCGWRSLVPEVGLEAVLLRAENEKMDVESAVEELARASLIDRYENPEEAMAFVGVPLTATLFGRRKLAVSPMAPSIEADLELLRAFGASRATDVSAGVGHRIERAFLEISARIGKKGQTIDKYLSIMEFLARRYPKGWMLLARLHEEVGGLGWIDMAKDAIRRYIETTPKGPEQVAAWRKLAHLCEQTQDPAGEAHALVELARLENVSYGVISSAATRLSTLFSGPSGSLDSQAKRIMACRVAELMESRLAEADATDLSRLAWLYLHMKDEAEAKKYTSMGLAMQPDNVHISKLAERLGLA